MNSEEGEDTAPCQGTTAVETAWDTLLRRSQVPTTPVPTQAPHSPGHRGHQSTLPAITVLLLPYIRALGGKTQDTRMIGYSRQRAIDFKEYSLLKARVRRGFSALFNVCAHTQPNHSSHTILLISSANAARQETHFDTSVWENAMFDTGLGKKAAYKRLHCHDSK